MKGINSLSSNNKILIQNIDDSTKKRQEQNPISEIQGWFTTKKYVNVIDIIILFVQNLYKPLRK